MLQVAAKSFGALLTNSCMFKVYVFVCYRSGSLLHERPKTINRYDINDATFITKTLSKIQ